MKKFIVLFILFCVSPCFGGYTGSSPDLYPDTLAYADVAAAIAAATKGDTIHLPAGDETWTSNFLLTTGINLIGAGVDHTIVRNGMSGAGAPYYLIRYAQSSYATDDPFRISGVTFDSQGQYAVQLGGSQSAPFGLQTKVRVDHCKFINSTGDDIKGQSIWNWGTLYGVVDNNIFTGVRYPICHHSGSGIDDWWANEPQNIFEHGSAYYMYFEDNTFVFDDENWIVTDGEYSGRYVFRYNTITTDYLTYNLFDLHGYQPLGDMDACFGGELYGNDISAGSSGIGFLKQRAGQVLAFANNCTTSGSFYLTAYTGTTSDPCPVEDNAADKVIHNTYWWANRKSMTGAFANGTATADLDCAGLEDIPTLGRDVFTDASTPGVSYGTLAAMQAITPTALGAGFWVTDQDLSDLTDYVGANPTTPISGILYRSVSDGEGGYEWELYYTPYTYPHPLRGQNHTITLSGPHNLTINTGPYTVTVE